MLAMRAMIERPCMGIAVNVLEPGERVIFDGVELLLERHRVRFPARCMLSLPFGQRPIPDESRGVAGALEVVGLLRRRTQGNLVSQVHGLIPGAALRSVVFGRCSARRAEMSSNEQSSSRRAPCPAPTITAPG